MCALLHYPSSQAMDIERVHVKQKKAQSQAMDIERVHVKINKVQPEDVSALPFGVRLNYYVIKE